MDDFVIPLALFCHKKKWTAALLELQLHKSIWIGPTWIQPVVWFWAKSEIGCSRLTSGSGLPIELLTIGFDSQVLHHSPLLWNHGSKTALEIGGMWREFYNLYTLISPWISLKSYVLGEIRSHVILPICFDAVIKCIFAKSAIGSMLV